MTRLPTYLTVHMVRFAWKADIEKKAKIMVDRCFPVNETELTSEFSEESNFQMNLTPWISSQTNSSRSCYQLADGYWKSRRIGESGGKLGRG